MWPDNTVKCFEVYGSKKSVEWPLIEGGSPFVGIRPEGGELKIPEEVGKFL